MAAGPQRPEDGACAGSDSPERRIKEDEKQCDRRYIGEKKDEDLGGDRTEAGWYQEGVEPALHPEEKQKSPGSHPQDGLPLFSMGLQSAPVKAAANAVGLTSLMSAGPIAPSFDVSDRLKKVEPSVGSLEGLTLGGCGPQLLQKI